MEKTTSVGEAVALSPLSTLVRYVPDFHVVAGFIICSAIGTRDPHRLSRYLRSQLKEKPALPGAVGGESGTGVGAGVAKGIVPAGVGRLSAGWTRHHNNARDGLCQFGGVPSISEKK